MKSLGLNSIIPPSAFHIVFTKRLLSKSKCQKPFLWIHSHICVLSFDIDLNFGL